MAMTAHTIAEHRPPLKRIETDLKPRAIEPPAIDVDCIGKFIEQERVWRLVRQSAEGVNCPTEIT